MNIKNLIIASALITSATSAFAENHYPPEQIFVSTKTRAEVVAEINQSGGDLARKNYAATFNPGTAVASTKTRAEVVAELKDGNNNLVRNYDTYGGQ